MGAADSPGQSFGTSCATGLAAGTRQCRISVASSSGNAWKCTERLTRIILKQQNHLGREFVCLPLSPCVWPDGCVPKRWPIEELGTRGEANMISAAFPYQ